MYLSSRHREHLQEGLLLLQFCSDFWEQDSTYFQRGKWKYTDLFLLACFAEICDMASLLRMTVSLEVAVDTIVDAALPMIIMNAIGMIVFISNFNGVIYFSRIWKAPNRSRRCLYFPKMSSNFCKMAG